MDASLETGLIREDMVSKTKMTNEWEKGKKERERERERESKKKMKTNVESSLINQPRFSKGECGLHIGKRQPSP